MATLTLTITVPGAASAYQAVANDFLQGLKQKGLFKLVADVAGEQSPFHGIGGSTDQGSGITATATFS